MKKKMILIDGHNLLFRMFYGIPAVIKNSNGIDIRGLIGFLGSLKKIINTFHPYGIIVLFDSETSIKNNKEIDKEYKSNRKDYTNALESENPFTVLPFIYKALRYLGIPYKECVGMEADDYIASLVNYRKKEYDYIIVSTDSDFIQLIDKHCFLYVPRGKKGLLMNEEEVWLKYNVSPSSFLLYKALVGDRADNIKGIKGIGPKTAVKIVNYSDYLSYEGSKRIKQLLDGHQDVIQKNKKLIAFNKTNCLDENLYMPLNNKINIYKTMEIIDKIGAK